MILVVGFLIIAGTVAAENASPTPPNIVFIVADDLGWNDVGYHGSNQILTPNIDALAYNGVILNRHYTLPTCTPSRAALLTGRHAITVGMQGFPLRAGEPRGLPTDVKLLPQYLKELGYDTHLIGKWHLGFCNVRYTPTQRGFSTHYGYWTGYIDHFNHTGKQKVVGQDIWEGLDFHCGLSDVPEAGGQYATHLFTSRAEQIIKQHNTTKPLFLQLSHLVPHGPLQIPDSEEAAQRFPHIADEERRMYAEMVWQLDQSVGKVVEALHNKSILNNTILVFISDNGAPTVGLHYNTGSNWPFRGMKYTTFEGGVRTPALLWTPQLKERGKVLDHLFHITDWLPTLYRAAGGDVCSLEQLNGVDQWEVIMGDANSVRRSGLLINIDEVLRTEGIIGLDHWKLVLNEDGHGRHDGFMGDSGRGGSETYDGLALLSCPAATAFATLHGALNLSTVIATRTRAEVACPQRTQHAPSNLTGTPPCANYCLYDLQADPCETENVINDWPEIAQTLRHLLEEERTRLMPQLNQHVDNQSNPALHNGSWVPWLDEPTQLYNQTAAVQCLLSS